MGKLPPPPPKIEKAPAKQNVPVNPALRERARTEIERAFTSTDPVIRANAIEAAQDGMGLEARDLILNGLNDPEPLVRFASSVAAGRLRLVAAKQKLQTMVGEPDPYIAVGVRFALHRLGDTRLTHDLEKYAMDPDPRVRGNTALVLGLMEEPSALNVLKIMKNDRSPVVRWQVAEAMWRLGNEDALKDLVSGSISQFADDQMICTLALAAPRDQRVAEHVRGKLAFQPGSGWEEVSLVAARALGMLGSDDGYHTAMIGAKSSDARQRQLAALALGAIGRPDTQSTVERLMNDQIMPVRLAAATAMLQLHE
jgi:HEAT repeat protein